MAQRLKRAVGLLRIVMGVLLLCYLVYFADWASVLLSLAEVSLADLCVLALIAVLLIVVSVCKWKLFLERLGIHASFAHLSRLYLIGYFVNLVMPSYVGGDVVRSLYVGKNVDRAHAVSATLLERYTGFIAMVCMALVALLFSARLPRDIIVLVILVAFGAVLGSILLFMRKFSTIVKALRLPQRVVEISSRIEDGIVWGVGDAQLLGQAALLSLSFHILTIVNTAAVASAIGWDYARWADLFVVVPLILLVGAIPISPQGLGIQEGAFLFFLHAAGASDAQALSVGLVLRAKSYVLALIGGVLWLGMKGERRRQVQPAESVNDS